MVSSWKLRKIDLFTFGPDSSTELTTYRKQREKQITKWRENNYCDVNNCNIDENSNYVTMPQQAREINTNNKFGNDRENCSRSFREERRIEIAPGKMEDENRKFKHPNLGVFEKRKAHVRSRVQKAKENFVSKNRKFLVDAIQNYKKEEKGIHLDIPNLNGAIRMSIESLSFPKDILKQLGDQNGSGRNGKLCNLEAGWLPKKDLDLISDEYCHHILPDQIKQPKSMDERKKERQAHSKEIETLLVEKRRFDPTVALSYLFS